ncbi:MAG: c-type cytochrome [Leptospiraceae bacterium]|nr:c-type cytochrome [Leptospiraceae bacterium]
MSQDDNKEFDGIRQADNPMPEWYKGIFIACVVAGIGYAIYFHFFSKWDTESHFLSEVSDHEKKFPQPKKIVSVDGSNPLRGQAEAIEEGKKNFAGICAACHGPEAKGIIGPSLVDAEWLHGSTDKEIFDVVMKGIPVEKTKLKKGPMPPHEASMGSEKVYQILAWIADKNPSLKSK